MYLSIVSCNIKQQIYKETNGQRGGDKKKLFKDFYNK